MEDNIGSQVEEIEALCAIYGEQWHTEDESSRVYSILVSEGRQNIMVRFTLPPEYPSQAPPLYEFSAPSLSRLDKLELSGKLENIYLENLGESILYQWVEATKEFLREKSHHKESSCETVEEDKVVLSADCPTSTVGVQEVPLITHGETITDRKSIFQGHTAVVSSVDQVKLVLSHLLQNKKIANATHNMYAYRVEKGAQPGCLVQDCEDDGEDAAGGRLLHLLQIMGVMNVMVVVSRWYGGIHLGPDRFRHINNAARQVLQQAGLANSKK